MKQIKELKWFIEMVGQVVERKCEERDNTVQIRVFNEEHAKWLYDTQFDGDTYDYTKTAVNSILKWE
jgi:hypothetical protein